VGNGSYITNSLDPLDRPNNGSKSACAGVSYLVLCVVAYPWYKLCGHVASNTGQPHLENVSDEDGNSVQATGPGTFPNLPLLAAIPAVT
jgi:hypothetical protein